MRKFLLFSALSIGITAQAQDKHINSLPVGTYETSMKGNSGEWSRGDIIILNEKYYKTSASEETGEYRFSASAQRIFFTSGPLRSFYAKTSLANNEPAILLPVPENEHLGVKLSADIWCYYRH